MRPRADPAQPLEVATRLGAVIRIDQDTELRIGGWSIGHDWK
jgi:hypothetical protein